MSISEVENYANDVIVESPKLSISKSTKKSIVTMLDLGTGMDDDEFFAPKPGFRINWMADSGLDFNEYGLKLLEEKKQAIFQEFVPYFQEKLKENKEIDKTDCDFQVPDEYTMLRFLQADDYDISKATTRLLRTLTWRQKSGFEKFVSNPNRKAYKLYCLLRARQTIGTDKNGRVFLVERVGDFFSDDSIVKAMPLKLWILCYAYDLAQFLQATRESSIKNKKLIHHISYLACLKNLSFWSATKMLPFLKSLSQEVETYFPEAVATVCVIGANSFTEKLWSLAKVFIDKKTASKVNISANIPKEFLENQVGLDYVPKEFGGSIDIVVRKAIPMKAAFEKLGLHGPISDDGI